MAIIIDTSGIFAIAAKNDKNHKKSADFVAKNKDVLITPVTVIPEACYLINEHINSAAELSFLKSLSSGDIQIESFKENDLERTIEILDKYKDLNIGFVDSSIVAIAERLNISKLFTFDRKHFSAIRFKKAYFDLVP